MSTPVADVERWLDALYVAAEGATLRVEDRRKGRQVAAILDEIARSAVRVSRRTPLVLVDAAAGKSYVGLLAAKLVLEPSRRPARVITLERDAARVAASLRALARLQTTVASAPFHCRLAACVRTRCGRRDRADDCRRRAHVTAGSVLHQPGHARGAACRGGSAAARHSAPRAGPAPLHPGHGGRRADVAPGVRRV
jgi:hypothetical protein